jgi:biopolymer transport protein ExbB/TolQ
MARSQVPLSRENAAPRPPRSRATQAAFLIGLPLAAGILALIHYGPFPEEVRRYVSHTVECVEVVLFCGALGTLGTKFFGSFAERRACRAVLLPPWQGQPVPVSEAARLRAEVCSRPARLQNTMIGRRVLAILDFLVNRGSAAELDDHLRSLADNDALAMDGSYSLTRFITWAIPILGFLGTVLGITGSINGITPEVLEKNLNQVTDSLALAFDATALALGLTMVTMFLSFLVERAEQSVLDAVDRYADRELAHRFERLATDGGEFVAVVRRNTEVLLETVEQVVQRQAVLWAQALEEADRRRTKVEEKLHERFAAALETALTRTLETHGRQLTALDKQVVDQSGGLVQQLNTLAATVRDSGREQQAALAKVAQSVAGQVQALTVLQEGERHLLRLQETLNQNLAALGGTGTFEQALHSLTAAIHLLTARATPAASTNRPGSRAA